MDFHAVSEMAVAWTQMQHKRQERLSSQVRWLEQWLQTEPLLQQRATGRWTPEAEGVVKVEAGRFTETLTVEDWRLVGCRGVDGGALVGAKGETPLEGGLEDRTVTKLWQLGLDVKVFSQLDVCTHASCSLPFLFSFSWCSSERPGCAAAILSALAPLNPFELDYF